MPVNLILTAASLLAPFVVYGSMAVREKIVVAAAVRAERAEQVAACNVRVSDLARVHNDKVAAAAEAARAAADAIDHTPETDSGIAELCKRSASCRSRKGGK